MSPPTFELRIEKVVSGGNGLGRHAGRVVFVPAAAPGEVHRVEIVSEKKDYIRARSLAIVSSPSPSRREPPCPYYGECGGCSMMHLDVGAQVEIKRSILCESLARAGVPFEGTVQLRTAPEAGYRNRLKFHIAPDGDGTRMGFRRRETQDLVDVDACMLASVEMNRTWQHCRRWMSEHPRVTRHLAGIELQESSSSPGRIFARFIVSSGRGGEGRAIRELNRVSGKALASELGLNGWITSGVKGGLRGRAGQPWVDHVVGQTSFRQSAGSFFQTNRFLLGELLEAVLPTETVGRALDLHCGVGFFAIPLASRAESVVGIEVSPRALRDARSNAKHAGLDNLRFLCGDAAGVVGSIELSETDFVVVDPPRGGLERNLRRVLGEASLRSIRYVSCDAPAFARDTAELRGFGFRLEALSLVDLFPNTHHFETVAVLSR